MNACIQPDLLPSYRRWWRGLGRSPETVGNYCRSLCKLAEHTAKPLLSITRADIEDYLAHRVDSVSAATAHVDYRAVRSFYGWALDEAEVDVNPAAKVRAPKVPLSAVTVAQPDDYERLQAACKADRTTMGRRDAAVVALLWASGLRRAELVRLTLADIDLDERTVMIRKAKNDTPRTVPMNDEAVLYLDRWLRYRGTEAGPLFPSRKGGKALTPNGLGALVAERRKQAGGAPSPHAFRRALAGRWLDAGGSEVGLMRVAGWKSPSMVARYTRMQGEKLAAAEYGRLGL